MLEVKDLTIDVSRDAVGMKVVLGRPGPRFMAQFGSHWTVHWPCSELRWDQVCTYVNTVTLWSRF